MFTRQSTSVLAVTLLYLFVVDSVPSAAADDLQIFAQAPEPRALAKILYAPRYRSAVSAEKEQRFGMLVNFRLDSVELLPESIPLLQSVGEMLDLPQAKGELLLIEGHTDATGSDAYNQTLSLRRAKAIKRYLVHNHGIDSQRLVTIGHGEDRLHDVDSPEGGINRRAEFRSLDGIVVR